MLLASSCRSYLGKKLRGEPPPPRSIGRVRVEQSEKEKQKPQPLSETSSGASSHTRDSGKTNKLTVTLHRLNLMLTDARRMGGGGRNRDFAVFYFTNPLGPPSWAADDIWILTAAEEVCYLTSSKRNSSITGLVRTSRAICSTFLRAASSERPLRSRTKNLPWRTDWISECPREERAWWMVCP